MVWFLLNCLIKLFALIDIVQFIAHWCCLVFDYFAAVWFLWLFCRCLFFLLSLVNNSLTVLVCFSYLSLFICSLTWAFFLSLCRYSLLVVQFVLVCTKLLMTFPVSASLESVNIPRARAVEALKLFKHFDEFLDGQTSMAPVFKDKTRLY